MNLHNCATNCYEFAINFQHISKRVEITKGALL